MMVLRGGRAYALISGALHQFQSPNNAAPRLCMRRMPIDADMAMTGTASATVDCIFI